MARHGSILPPCSDVAAAGAAALAGIPAHEAHGSVGSHTALVRRRMSGQVGAQGDGGSGDREKSAGEGLATGTQKDYTCRARDGLHADLRLVNAERELYFDARLGLNVDTYSPVS